MKARRRLKSTELRHYADFNVYFKIISVYTQTNKPEFTEDYSIDEHLISKGESYPTLEKALVSVRNDGCIMKQLSSYDCELMIGMFTLSNNRDSKPTNILHFCKMALFIYNNQLKLIKILFILRNNIDKRLKSIIAYNTTNGEYSEYEDKSVIARDFFKDECVDRELADFILRNETLIK